MDPHYPWYHSTGVHVPLELDLIDQLIFVLNRGQGVLLDCFQCKKLFPVYFVVFFVSMVLNSLDIGILLGLV